MARAPTTAEEIAEEAARLICDDGYTDYRQARTRAAQDLGGGRHAPLPELTAIESRVLERQRLFGGAHYVQHLQHMRHTALRAMALLARFEPRLSGGVVSGAIGEGHRVQIHVIADQPEAVEMLLHDRHLGFDQDERRYRLADGRERDIPLLRFEADGIGMDIAVFGPESVRHPPLSPIDGRPARRLGAEQVQALLDAGR